MVSKEGETPAVPEAVTDAVTRTLANLEEFQSHFRDFVALAEPDVLADLAPLQRAQVLFVFAKAVSTLYTLRLRCSGLNPDDHPVKGELERLGLYEDKLERFNEWNRAPLRPSTTVNRQAATRFIEHSLPDLTPEQRKSMRDISSQGGKSSFNGSRSDHKKRKWQSSYKKSVQAAAQEFLEKAKQELLGAKESHLKGPLRNDNSDGEDGQ